MHIGMVHFNGAGFPPDIRIQKEVDALLRAGHQVTLLTEVTKSHANTHEKLALGFEVVRVAVPKKSIFEKIREKRTLFSPKMKRLMSEFIDTYEVDVLHIHDFPFVPTAVVSAQEKKIPVIADLHENMPAALRAYRSDYPAHKKAFHAMVHPYRLWRSAERYWLPLCDRVIVVVEEGATRLLADGVLEENIYVVSNTEDETTFPLGSLSTERIKKYEKFWVASYIGGIGPHRGIDTVIRSLKEVEISNFLLLVVGINPAQQQQVNELAVKEGVRHLIEMLPWQPFEMVNEYMMASDVCLVPHNDFEHTQTTIPHKLFQYMMSEKPVLVSDCAPLKRIVESCNGGFVFKASDPKSCAEQLRFIKGHREEAKRRAKNGKDAALTRFSWKRDAATLVNLYESLEKELV